MGGGRTRQLTEKMRVSLRAWKERGTTFYAAKGLRKKNAVYSPPLRVELTWNVRIFLFLLVILFLFPRTSLSPPPPLVTSRGQVTTYIKCPYYRSYPVFAALALPDLTYDEGRAARFGGPNGREFALLRCELCDPLRLVVSGCF